VNGSVIRGDGGFADRRRKPALATATGGYMPEAPASADNRLVWIDLEMTGLDLERHRIVEIAVLVTDAQLEVLENGLDLVVHQPPAALAEMDDFVRKMHTKSGLLEQIEVSSLTLEDAGKQAIEYIARFVPEPATAPMCGNSIGVDRRFLDRYLPDLDRYLHYRSIDVSSIKELCRRWYPAAYKKRPGKAEAHRALDDIRESVAELRYYRDTIMRPSGEAVDAPKPQE
jgi:oligoribonuclease